MKPHGLLLLSICMFASTQISAANLAPAWKELSFQRKSMWGNVEAEMQLQATEVDTEVRWNLDVNTRVGNNNEERVSLQLASLNGQIIDKQRFSRGRTDRRFKSYDYHSDGIARLRKDPAGGEAALPVEQWSISKQQHIEYPDLPEGAVLTTPYALFLLASDPRLASRDGQLCVYVHTDYNVYQVTLVNSGEQKLVASYTLTKGDEVTQYRKQSVVVDRIQLTVVPFSEPARPDFGVMGLSGEISFLVEQELRLPLRIQGRAPRVGDTHIDMTGAHY